MDNEFKWTAAKALRADVLEVRAYRAHCAHGSVNLSALSIKMAAVEESLAAFNALITDTDEGDK